MKSITITLSNVESGLDEEQSRRKALGALDDLISELCVQPVDKEAAFKAYLAAGQGLVSMMRAASKENLVGEDISFHVEEFFNRQNESHLERGRNV